MRGWLAKLARLVHLDVREQLSGVGFYIVLIIPDLVLLAVIFSAPAKSQTEVCIQSLLPFPAISEVREAVRHEGYPSTVVRSPRDMTRRILQEESALGLQVGRSGDLRWLANAPQTEHQFAAAVGNIVGGKLEESRIDLLKSLRARQPLLPVTMADPMPAADQKDCLVGLASVVGTWFIAAVVTIMVGLDFFRLIERLKMRYSPPTIFLSKLLSSSMLGAVPGIIMFGTAALLGFRMEPLGNAVLTGALAVLSGVLSGLLMVFFARQVSGSFNQLTFVSFMLVTQGFIASVQYSGVFLPIGSMDEVTRIVAKILPMYWLCELFRWSSLASLPVTDWRCQRLVAIIALYLAVQTLLTYLLVARRTA